MTLSNLSMEEIKLRARVEALENENATLREERRLMRNTPLMKLNEQLFITVQELAIENERLKKEMRHDTAI